MIRVTTESGTRYLLDENAQTIQRVPGDTSNPLYIDMRRDSDILPLVGDFPAINVGESMKFLIAGLAENAITLRTTSPVVAIDYA